MIETLAQGRILTSLVQIDTSKVNQQTSATGKFSIRYTITVVKQNTVRK